MLHGSACISTCTYTVLFHLCNTSLISTSFSPPILLTRRITRHLTCLPRAYNTVPSRVRRVPGSAPTLLPATRSPRPHNVEPYKKSNLKLELRWLKDPVRLADRTVKLLQKDDFLKALEMVRLASKDVECTVSWNHLIDYEMGKARVTEAIKLYNEMKKRAQLPDSYTFTILFRGLSWYPHLSKSTSRALSIYQSMFAENSPVRPSIIHTNAVVNVCALAHDIDALLGIAAELPDSGTGAPNKQTFTIILNAIRSDAFGGEDPQEAIPTGEGSERNEKIASAVQQGRRLWWDIRKRWMSGDLALDEEIVCAMGRLLLLGNEARDMDDVLSLLEQTMGIPRQIARLGDPALGRAEEPSEPNDNSELSSGLKANVEILLPRKEEYNSPNSPSDPLAPLSSDPKLIQSAVRPGHNTLSLLLDACIRLKFVRAAQNYWALLTSPDGHYKIAPDAENHHMYLRLLRLQRASKLAVELVDEMRSGKLTGNARDVQAKTFRIALSCCARDVNNRNSIVHAGKLVRMMTDTLPHPDAKALSMYLKVALGHKPQDWRIIMGAIRGTELGVRNLRSLMAYELAGRRKQNHEDVLKLVKELIGAFDVVLDLGNEEIRDEEKKKCKEQKFTLTAYITRMHTVYMRLPRRNAEVLGDDGKSIPFKRKQMLKKRLSP